MMLLWRWFTHYRMGIIARAERDGSPNVGSIQTVMIPWAVPLLGVTGLVMLFDPSESWRTAMTLVVGIPAFLGMMYAGGTYFWASLKAERRGPRPN